MIIDIRAFDIPIPNYFDSLAMQEINIWIRKIQTEYSTRRKAKYKIYVILKLQIKS